MIRRVPVIPTTIVLLAAAIMVYLGFWQIDRLHWKEDLLARYDRNQHLPPIAFPANPVGDANLFRKAEAMCLKPASWTVEGGRSGTDVVGWRQIARCSTGAEGPGFSVQLGVSKEPRWTPTFEGGEVSGYIGHLPSHTSLLATMFGRGGPDELMLVADTPAPGLMPNPGPDPSSIPNNHLAYAVQWFLFAGLALLIYALALRKRLKDTAT
jgi:cytochrome oxidase assembly protein ShyY1